MILSKIEIDRVEVKLDFLPERYIPECPCTKHIPECSIMVRIVVEILALCVQEDSFPPVTSLLVLLMRGMCILDQNMRRCSMSLSCLCLEYMTAS